MNIAEIHVYSVTLPIQGEPYRFSGSALTTVQTTVVKLVDSSGYVGWGEACPLGATYQPEHSLGVQAALKHLAPALIGASARAPVQLNRLMRCHLNGHASAKAAINIAALDLCAKAYGIRVCDLLGGPATERVPAYYAIGLCDPDEAARITREKMAEGFTRLQIKIGGRSGRACGRCQPRNDNARCDRIQ